MEEEIVPKYCYLASPREFLRQEKEASSLSELPFCSVVITPPSASLKGNGGDLAIGGIG